MLSAGDRPPSGLSFFGCLTTTRIEEQQQLQWASSFNPDIKFVQHVWCVYAACMCDMTSNKRCVCPSLAAWSVDRRWLKNRDLLSRLEKTLMGKRESLNQAVAKVSSFSISFDTCLISTCSNSGRKDGAFIITVQSNAIKISISSTLTAGNQNCPYLDFWRSRTR